MVTSKAQHIIVLSTGAAFQEEQSVLQAIPATQTPHEHMHSNSYELLLPGISTYTEEEGIHTRDRTPCSSKKECSMS